MKEDKRADAIYEFMGRLTTMKKPVTLSGKHHAGVGADLVDEFLKEKGWEVTFKWSNGRGRIGYRIHWLIEDFKIRLSGLATKMPWISTKA